MKRLLLQQIKLQFLGTDIGIPFSEKKSIIILNYAAKLGIRTHVKVEQISEKKYKIIVPNMKC